MTQQGDGRCVWKLPYNAGLDPHLTDAILELERLIEMPIDMQPSRNGNKTYVWFL